MAVPYYNVGTATLTTGSAAMVGQGTLWLGNVRPGDQVVSYSGETAIVGTVDSNTSITLARAFRGTSQTAAAYEITYTPDDPFTQTLARKVLQSVSSSALVALGDVPQSPQNVVGFDPAGNAALFPFTQFVNGAQYDVQVNVLADRAAYNTRPAGFTVLVSNVGDGRAALYTKNSVTSGDWTNPAYVTGPAITLAVTEVDEVPYGVPPAVVMTPKAGGYDLAFDIPRGMLIVPGTTTTLAPDQPAAVTFVPVTGGYRLDIAIPKGPTGDINGVTPFWVTRLGSDANAAAARAGLGANDAGNLNTGTLLDARLPARLGTSATAVTDWNTAFSSGWYISNNTAINGPELYWHIGRVECANAGNVTQTVWRYGNFGAADTFTWQRAMISGAWGAWYRLRLSEAEQQALWDARYIPKTEKASMLINVGAAVSTISGIAIDFTSIPSGVKRITLNLTQVSTNGSSPVGVMIGSASAWLGTPSYQAVCSAFVGSTATTFFSPTGFFQVVSGAPTAQRNGTITLSRAHTTAHTWEISALTSDVQNLALGTISGVATLPSELTRVRLTTLNGTDAFDDGNIALTWEL